MGNSSLRLWSLVFLQVRRGASGAGGAPRRHRGKRMNSATTVVESTEGNGGKANRPEAIVNFFQGDVGAGQGFADKQRRPAPGDLSDGRDASDLKMPGITAVQIS